MQNTAADTRGCIDVCQHDPVARQNTFDNITFDNITLLDSDWSIT